MPGLHLEYSNCVLTHLLQVSPRFAAKNGSTQRGNKTRTSKVVYAVGLSGTSCTPLSAFSGRYQWSYSLRMWVAVHRCRPSLKVPVELLFEEVGSWQSVDSCLLSVVCHAIASAHAVITLREVGAICEHSHRDSTSMQVPDMSACRLSELPLGRAQGVLMR